jgi:hypothetical protein
MIRDSIDVIGTSRRGVGYPSLAKISRGLQAAEFTRGQAIGLPCAEGRWQTRSLFVFDAKTRSLIRRTYTVWNALPADELDFRWLPEHVEGDVAGRITGTGRLIWREKGKPDYDRDWVYAEYVGEMKDGKPEGKGVYCDRPGFRYEGNWSAGQCDGTGRLQLPNGDEYRGSFSGGTAHGQGVYFQSHGEIHQGSFSYGFRDGTALITLANGISYSSQWAQGAEHSESRLLRLAQLGPPAAAVDDVRLGIVVDNSPLKKGMLGYSSMHTTERLVIQPANDRLMELWKGSGDIELTDRDVNPELGGLFSWQGESGGGAWSAAVLPPVLLVLDIESRAPNPIQVIDAYLDIAKSSTDFQPLVVVPYEPCPQSESDPTVIINNYGWAPLQEASVKLTLARPGQPPDRAELAWSKQLGSIEKTATLSVEAKLSEAGINVKALERRKRSFSCRSKSQSECFSEVLRSGMFGRAAPYVTRKYDFFIVANLTGSLQYKWDDNDGNTHVRESPCTVQPTLGTLEHQAECEGADIQGINTTAPLMLRADGKGYKMPFKFRTTIDPGRVARYSVPVRGSKSSRHDFQVVLVLADGREIRSRLIDLLYFLPNTWGKKSL